MAQYASHDARHAASAHALLLRTRTRPVYVPPSGKRLVRRARKRGCAFYHSQQHVVTLVGWGQRAAAPNTPRVRGGSNRNVSSRLFSVQIETPNGARNRIVSEAFNDSVRTPGQRSAPPRDAPFSARMASQQGARHRWQYIQRRLVEGSFQRHEAQMSPHHFCNPVEKATEGILPALSTRTADVKGV